MFYSTRRFYTRHTSVSFDRCGKGRTFTTYERTGATVDMEMDTEICTKNVITDQTKFFCLCDRDTQTLYCQRILSTYIDVCVLCTCQIGSDQHTFQHLMRVTFHDASIHERTRVTLITITYYITVCLFLTCHLFPFLTCRETAAASSAKVGFFYHVKTFFFGHFEEDFFKTGISAYCDVFFDILCVDMSTVLKYQTHLSGIERDGFFALVYLSVLMVKQPLDRLPLTDSFLIDFFAVFWFNLNVEDSERFDSHQRSHFAEAMASALLDLRMWNFTFEFYRNILVDLCEIVHFFINFFGAAGNTSSSCADKNTYFLSVQFRFCLLA